MSERQAMRDAVATVVAGLAVASSSAAVLGHVYAATATTMSMAAAVGSLPAILSAAAVLHRRPRTSSLADRVTLARMAMASGCAAITAMVLAGAVPARTWWLLSLTIPTLVLDAVDGLVARRTGSATAAGARLDTQADAGFLVVLSLAVTPVIGVWVLLIGAMRYLFVAASWLRPILRTPMPSSQFRRAVAALQGAVLAVAIAPIVPIEPARLGVLLALGLLLVSFGTEVVTKERLAHEARAAGRTR